MSLFFASTIAPRCVRHPLALCCAAALAASVPLSARAADDAGLADPIELNRVEVHADAVAGYGAPPSSAGTGLRLTARETPQSVSVLTREQLDDFGLDNLNDALDAAPGIGVERVETGRTYYTARGFDISNFQFDGLGVPLPYGIQDGDIDLAMFDRVEVLRGANGLMSATGNPSATINFVRKRPTAAFEGAVQATLGSWDRQRLDLDVGGPLGSDAVRGRLMAAYENGDSHLDRYGLEKSLVYGVVDADLGPSTRLTVGLSRQDNNADSPLWGALPLFYADGSPTSYGRSTSTATDWAYWDTRDTRAFAEIAHAFGNGWSLRAAFNHQDKDQDSELFYVYGTPDRDTGLGLFAYPSAYAGTARSRHVDARASGPLALGGRRHEAVVGASWAESRVRELSWYGSDVGTPLGAGGAFDGRYPKPTFDSDSDGSDFEFRRDTLYANVRWDLADTFKLITGANHARVRMAGTGYGTPKDSEVTRTTPFVGAVWDIASAYSLYASYGGILPSRPNSMRRARRSRRSKAPASRPVSRARGSTAGSMPRRPCSEWSRTIWRATSASMWTAAARSMPARTRVRAAWSWNSPVRWARSGRCPLAGRACGSRTMPATTAVPTCRAPRCGRRQSRVSMRCRGCASAVRCAGRAISGSPWCCRTARPRGWNRMRTPWSG